VPCGKSGIITSISVWLQDFATTGAPFIFTTPQARVPSQNEVPTMKTRRRPADTFWRSGAMLIMVGGTLQIRRKRYEQANPS
jgi:hypothetical protein